MESKKISDNFSELTENIKEYVHLKFDIFKLSLTEKFARLASFAVIMLIFFIIFLFFSLFVSLAFILWFRDHIGPAYIGSLIVAASYLILGGVIYLLRNSLFINPLVEQLSQILLEEAPDDNED
jgi:hypothetical protein